MEFSWLEDFLALVDCGNFSRAAEKRHMTQPAFSRRIRALEDWIGAVLFDRTTHRVTMTPAGEAFRPIAEELVRRLLQGREEVRQASGATVAALKFAATHVLSLRFFPSWLRSLEGAINPTALHLTSDTMRACVNSISQGQAQFLLCHHHPALPDELDLHRRQFRSLRVGNDVLLPVTAPDEKGRPRFELTRGHDRPLPLLGYSRDSALAWIVQSIVANDDRSALLEPVFTAHLATVLKAMVRDGRGVAWLPLSLVTEDLDSGELLRAGDAQWEAPVEIRLFRPRSRQSLTAEEFWAQLVELHGQN